MFVWDGVCGVGDGNVRCYVILLSLMFVWDGGVCGVGDGNVRCYVILFSLMFVRDVVGGVGDGNGHCYAESMDMSILTVSCPMSMHGCGVVTASKACTKAWVTCVATCDATKFRGGDLGKMEQKCSKSRDNWLWSVTLTGNSGHHIYMSTRRNCKTHGFLANPSNRTVETSSKTHGLLRAPSPCLWVPPVAHVRVQSSAQS